MHTIPEKIISGGQTGADQAGLESAKMFGIPTGGFAPYRFMTTAGEAPFLGEKYGLIETTFGYKDRTKLNIEESDCTIIIVSDMYSPGTRLATKHLKELKKPYVLVCYNPKCDLLEWTMQPDLKKAIDMLDSFGYNKPILNVAGNSEKTCPFSYRYSMFFMYNLLEIITAKNV
jgi:hypothetical protein